MRLIDADALEERMATVYTDTDLRARYSEIMRVIREQPTVDAVPVVRCKDCKWRTGAAFWTPCKYMPTTDDWYCGFGERRDAKG